MPFFEYQNKGGDIREVEASSASVLPEWVSFDPDGSARAAIANDPLAYHRIISAGQRPIVSRKTAGCSHKSQPLPVSYGLPRTKEQGEVVNRWGHRVRKLNNGAYATMEGRRIVDGTESRARHAAETGYIPSND